MYWKLFPERNNRYRIIRKSQTYVRIQASTIFANHPRTVAEHSLTGHLVAIKIISRRKMAGQDLQARVQREIQILKVLRHPHIIRL